MLFAGSIWEDLGRLGTLEILSDPLLLPFQSKPALLSLPMTDSQQDFDWGPGTPVNPLPPGGHHLLLPATALAISSGQEQLSLVSTLEWSGQTSNVDPRDYKKRMSPPYRL